MCSGSILLNVAANQRISSLPWIGSVQVTCCQQIKVRSFHYLGCRRRLCDGVFLFTFLFVCLFVSSFFLSFFLSFVSDIVFGYMSVLRLYFSFWRDILFIFSQVIWDVLFVCFFCSAYLWYWSWLQLKFETLFVKVYRAYLIYILYLFRLTAQYSSPAYMVWQCKLVSGWGNGDQCHRMCLMAAEGLHVFYVIFIHSYLWWLFPYVLSQVLCISDIAVSYGWSLRLYLLKVLIFHLVSYSIPYILPKFTC